jgi:hypothetical protein
MNKKNILRKFKTKLDETCSINTKLREPRVIFINGVETEVDPELLYKVGVLCYSELEKEDPEYKSNDLQEMKEYPLETNSWGFFRDWFFSWADTTSKKLSQNTFLMDLIDPEDEDKVRSYVKIPTVWYALAVYPDITEEMLDEMLPMHLKVLALNENIPDYIKDIVKKGGR